jgi:hypothetical protein
LSTLAKAIWHAEEHEARLKAEAKSHDQVQRLAVHSEQVAEYAEQKAVDLEEIKKQVHADLHERCLLMRAVTSMLCGAVLTTHPQCRQQAPLCCWASSCSIQFWGKPLKHQLARLQADELQAALESREPNPAAVPPELTASLKRLFNFIGDASNDAAAFAEQARDDAKRNRVHVHADGDSAALMVTNGAGSPQDVRCLPPPSTHARFQALIKACMATLIHRVLLEGCVRMLTRRCADKRLASGPSRICAPNRSS